jgi:hypothetical protein
MAKSDLLKEAIADAKAVKDTALENAKIALHEYFEPQVKEMLARKMQEELEDEDEMEAGAELEAGADEMEAGAEEMNTDMDMPDMVGIGIDFDNDGDYDLEGELGTGEEEVEMGEEGDEGDEFGDDEFGDEMPEDELNLEAIIRELEGEPEVPVDADQLEGIEGEEDTLITMGESIDEIIESILQEEEYEEKNEGAYGKHEGAHGKKEMYDEDAVVEELEAENEELQTELAEAYATVTELKNILSEVNLLNAKLLYTNKLFRNFELTEAQKMKVIENFDRTVTTREVKLVFTTLAESFNKPRGKRNVVKESVASKPMASTAPRKETTQVLHEGFEMSNRWKKLAGLL